MNTNSPRSSEERRRRNQQQLEAQLEIVLEREGVGCAPDIRVIGQRTEDAAYYRDLQQVNQLHIQQAVQRAKPIPVQRTAHEASPHVVRMRGRAAKPVIEHREAFHRHMHAWRTPMLESVQMQAVIVNTADLWVESLHESFFYDQFTPAHEHEAYRESRRGMWSHLRRPFITWKPSARPVSDLTPSITQQTDVLNETSWNIQTVEDALSPQVQEESIEQEAGEIAIMPSALPVQEAPRESSWWQKRTRRAQEAKQEAVYRAQVQAERLAASAPVQDEVSSWSVPAVEPHLRHERLIVSFLVLACFIALPAGAVAWSRGIVGQVQSATQVASAFDAAPISLTSIPEWSERFRELRVLATGIRGSSTVPLSLAKVLPGIRAEARAAHALLVIAEEGSEVARLWSLGMQRLLDSDVATPDERLVRLQGYIEEGEPAVERLLQAARELPLEGVPASYRERVERLQSELFAVEPLVRDARALTKTFLAMVGHERSRTYLVLFQNQAEVRPSGGFMGSYAEVTLDRGMIKRISIPGGGPYDLRSQLKKRWIPPEPLQLVGERWEFQDANWSPDFAETARTVNTFWSAAGQPTVDGIFAINASILPKLLAVTGPIEMPEYQKTLTAENVVFETQKAVELEYDKEQNTPKAFIGDLHREVLQRLQALPSEELPKLLAMFGEALQQKEAQMWFAREEEQLSARAFGWTGEWSRDEHGSFLSVIGANIAGQKSDAAVQESVRHRVVINERGAVQEAVTLERKHTAEPGELFYGANNVQYVRFFTPIGSRLLSMEGVEPPAESLFERPTEHEEVFPGSVSTTVRRIAGQLSADERLELGRTSFGGWTQVKPQSTQAFSATYELVKTTADTRQALLPPNSMTDVSDVYRLQLASQSGARRSYQLSLQYPPSWNVISAAGLEAVRPGELRLTQATWNHDQDLLVLFQRYANTSSTKE